jgi:multidrug efflux pump subunit AcrA (membrane-fusion protein)
MTMSHRKRIVTVVLAGIALGLGAAGIYWWRNGQFTLHLRDKGEAATASSLQLVPPPNVQASRSAPVQLTPHRMQSIGVTFGTAEVKPVNEEIRVTGNVAIDERRLAYVQTRFPGWIRKVYVNANYQYVHKGQPLFTIYSPELVTTEREYLLAKENAPALQASLIGGRCAGRQFAARGGPGPIGAMGRSAF